MISVNNITMDLGDQLGCTFDDIIYVPMSPTDIDTYMKIWEEKAMKPASLRGLDDVRKAIKYHDFFESIYDEWKRRRKTKGH